MKTRDKHLFVAILTSVCFTAVNGQGLKMNQTQVIGSHNSYKIRIEQPLMDMILTDRPEAIGLAYTHIPITDQLDLGLRSLEIDVLFDPEGGLFSNPKELEMLTTAGVNAQPYDAEPMREPGFKVLHVPDIDFRSHCATFKGCLSDVLTWSKAHNNHLPIIITINPKSDGLDRPGFAKVIPFDKQALDALDREIWEVFERRELITPKLVRGKQATLRDAVADKGWPNLSDARDKILFVFDAGKELTDVYLQNDEAYARPMFANTESDNPHAAFFIMNDPVKQEKEIAGLVKQGFMVRTRSDADTREARLGDKTRFEAAMRSGAQVITTDYYLKSLSPDKDFEIVFGDGRYQRCNPVLTKSSTCDLP
ncbi:MAG: phosphatidylinositol-specific phospholipase C1-like protein [Imperialibacter sp.]|uniref:phosphatidylinositol-specific phospholipase C1-like protein n=1 Tax=Imperialibacter sp. TaxID=2038411 RepID=UPI0032EF5F4D